MSLPEGCQERCRGCAHRLLSAQDSQAQKKAWLERRLEPWKERLESLRVSPQRWGYREKVCLSAWYDEGWQFGMWSRDERVAIPHCPVHSSRVRSALEWVGARLGTDYPLTYYVQSGAQVTLVVSRVPPVQPNWSDLEALGLEGLWMHLNPCAGRRIFGKLPWTLLAGQERSRDRLGLVHGPASFAQVCPELYARALQEAQDFLEPAPGEAVVDLFCGTGASLVRWGGARVLGVELAREAVECARVNAPQAEVLRGPCSQRLPQIKSWLGDGPLLVYANPPRLGLDEDLRAWLRDRPPRRMAYLSCSAGTLRRDLEELGLEVVRLIPLDFFPQTHHVEVLALLKPFSAASP